MLTCNQLDLQTLGSQPIMPKNLPDHCFMPKPLPSRNQCTGWFTLAPSLQLGH